MRNKKVLLLIVLIISVAVVEGWSFFAKPRVKINALGNGAVFTVQKNSPDLVNSVDEIKEEIIFPDESAENNEVREEFGKLELLGTAIGNIKDPIAYIKDLESNKQGLYKLGSKVNDAKVIKITMGEVVLDKNGQKEVLKLSKRGRLWAKMDEEGAAITPITENRIAVNRRELLNETSSICSSLAKMKITPYESKEASGMMVEGISKDSIVAMAGIRNKDVVTSVHNQKINSYQQALQIFNKIKNQSEIKISLLRDGKVTNLSYHFE
jgi:type II secretory pathway component PulC